MPESNGWLLPPDWPVSESLARWVLANYDRITAQLLYLATLVYDETQMELTFEDMAALMMLCAQRGRLPITHDNTFILEGW